MKRHTCLVTFVALTGTCWLGVGAALAEQAVVVLGRPSKDGGTGDLGFRLQHMRHQRH